MDLADNGPRHRTTHESVDRAPAALQSVPWGKLEDGRRELAAGVCAIMSSYTKEPAEAQLEVAEDYDPQGDTLFFRKALPKVRLQPPVQA